MSDVDPDLPVADDAFPEFAEAPRQRPPEGFESAGRESEERGSKADDRQAGVDDVLARLRRQRGEGGG